MENNGESAVLQEQKQVPSKREILIQQQKERELQQQQQKEFEYMQKSRLKRIEYLKSIVELRELEEKAFGQEKVISSIQHDIIIDTFVSLGKSELETLEYLESKNLLIGEDVELLKKLKG